MATTEELRRKAERMIDAHEAMIALLPGLPGGTVIDDAVEIARAYIADHSADETEPVTEAWLRSVGFLPNGDDLGEFAIRLWSVGETECYGTDPAMHYLWSVVDNSSWLEAYGTGGESLCLVELATNNARGDVRRLCRALGIDLKEKP